MAAEPYPVWSYFPRMARPPAWVQSFVEVVGEARPRIDSATHSNQGSDAVMAELRPGLEALDYQVETGKSAGAKLRRPVLFGDQGAELVAYEIDAFHPTHGIAVEIEAGRGAFGNAFYRDIIRASLLVDARFLCLGAMVEYRYNSGRRLLTEHSYDKTRGLLEAIYASGRLRLPFEGVLLVGY